MPEPRRERMLVQIETLLRAMSGIRPWGGQYESVPRVTRRWVPVGHLVEEYPLLIVSAASGSTFPMRSTGTATDGTFEHWFRVLVYGYVHGNDQTSASTWLQRLQDDVIDTMLRNQRLNDGTEDLCQEVYVDEDQTDDGVLEPLGAFAQVFRFQAPEVRAIQ